MTNKPFFYKAERTVFEKANALRKKLTKAEEILWEYLRNRKLNGFKFRRQHPLFHFIADFYCHQAKLVIEVDGSIHLIPEQKKYDTNRTYELSELGLKVIRFSNAEIENKIEFVLNEIKKHLIPNPIVSQ